MTEQDIKRLQEENAELQEKIVAYDRWISQNSGTAKREYPNGRMGANDEGSLALAIGVDMKANIVTVDFAKPTHWIGLPPQMAADLGCKLIDRAREIAKEPITVSFGDWDK